MADVEFYNMKLKRKVSVPENQLKKQVFSKCGAGGSTQRRYAVVAGSSGTKMFKFVSEATYASLKAPKIETQARGRGAGRHGAHWPAKPSMCVSMRQPSHVASASIARSTL